jgi:N-acetylmuramoyl-L-alanine amidase
VKKSVPAPGGQAFFKVQVGAFSERKNADDLIASLKYKGFNSFIYSENSQFKVQAGAFAERQNAEDLAACLKANGFNAYIHFD